MSSYEAKSQAKQNSDNVLGILRVFLDKHHLGLEELAGLLRITPRLWRNGSAKGWRRPQLSWPLQSSSIPKGKWPDEYRLKTVRAIKPRAA